LHTLSKLVNFGSAAAAFAAAVLWWAASTKTVASDYSEPIPTDVKYLNFHGGRGPIEITNAGKRIDVTATQRLQGKLNSYAAGSAAVAAFLQGIAMLLPQPPQ